MRELWDGQITLLYIGGIFINLLTAVGAPLISFCGGIGLIIFTIYKAEIMKKRDRRDANESSLRQELLKLQIDKLKNQ